MPASARMRRPSRCVPSSCTSRSSAPARPASSSPPSCTTRRARWCRTASTASIPTRTCRLILIEAADRILPALPQRLSDAATKLLAKLGVSVRTSARVAEVLPNGVRLASGEIIPAELVVWAAGVKAPDFLKDLDGLETNRINQLVVRPTLQTTRDDEHLRHRRLRRLSVAGQGRRAGAAARAGRAPAGVAHGEADHAPAAPASRSSRGAIATSARWFRSASTPPSAT